MKLHREIFKNSTQRSKWFYRSDEYAGVRDYSSSLYPRMLIQDIHLGLLPIGRTRQASGVVIRLDPPNKDFEQMLCQALGSSRRDARSLDEAVENFIRDVAGTLSHFGETFYEIVYFYDEHPNYRSFKLVQVPNWGLKKGLRYYTQQQPRQKISGQDGAKKRVKIPKGDIVRFRIPNGFSAPRRHRRLLRRLAELSDRTTPTKFMSPEQQKTGFDFSHYHNMEMLQVARLTRAIGWYARQLYQDRTNEFYLVYRYLRFELWRAMLREHITETLNEALHIVGRKMNFDSKVLIEGIPTAADLEKTINDLIGGKIEFSSAVEKPKVS